MNKTQSVRTTAVRLTRFAIIAAVLACDGSNAVAVSVVSNNSQTLTVPIGREFTITLGTVGPGSYAAPPAVSTDAVRYINVSEAEPIVPAGARQRFVFETTSRGTAVIVFTHSDRQPTVQDTVLVR